MVTMYNENCRRTLFLLMNQDWNVGDLTKVIYGSDNSSSRSKFNRDIFAKIRQFAKKTDKGVFVPRYVKGKKPRRKTNRRVEKINGEKGFGSFVR